MKSYKLNINALIVYVGLISLILFSTVLLVFHLAEPKGLGEMLLHYGYIIAPVSILWVLTDHYLWHTKFMQFIGKSLNIPPDIRGRWEGTLENADGSGTQRFAIEVNQTLTKLRVCSYSSKAHSDSVLAEIASSASEDSFTLCYLWQGQLIKAMKDTNPAEIIHGYTMLTLDQKNSTKVLKGYYFTDVRPVQTRGGIELKWVSHSFRKSLD